MGIFESPLFLVAQTRENIAEFDRICATIFTPDSCRRVTEIDRQTGNKTFKVVFAGEIPPRCRHIAASAINDLRHALDQATCAAIEAVTGADPGLLYFPFATNPKDLAGRLAKFPQEIRGAYLRFQSYPTGEGYDGGNDPLCALSKAAQRKHRISCKVGAEVKEISGGSISVIGSPASPAYLWMLPKWDIEKNELILGTTGPEGDIRYDTKIGLYIAFYDAGPLTGEPVNICVEILADMVERIVSDLDSEIGTILKARRG